MSLNFDEHDVRAQDLCPIDPYIPTSCRRAFGGNKNQD